MNKFKLVAPFSVSGDQPAAVAKITERFAVAKEQTLLGVTGSGKTFTVANIIERLQKPTLVLAPNKTLAAQLYAEFREFFPENAVEYFVSYYDYYQPEAYVPATDTYIEKESSINEEIDKLRHSTTRSLLERNDVIVVASVSCIYGIGSPDEYKAHKLFLEVGNDYDRSELLRQLVVMQYTRNDFDFTRGHFRVRGEVVEIFPACEDSQVIKLQFFGELLEEISLVDPLRGNSLKTSVSPSPLMRITVYPSSHYVVSKAKLERAMIGIKDELRQRLQQLESENKLLERQRLEQRTLLDLEMLEEMGMCPGIENYSRHLTGRSPGDSPPTLLDFFNNDFLIVIDESHVTVPQVRGMHAGDRARKQTLVDHGFRLPSAYDNRPLKFEEFCQRLDMVLYVSATPGDYELAQASNSGGVVEQIIRPTGLLDPVVEVRPAEHQVEDLLVLAKGVIAGGERVLVTTLTKRLAEELTTYYQGVGLRVRYLHSEIGTVERVQILHDLRQGNFDVLVGINLLREGLDLPEVALIGILDADREGFLRSYRSLIQIIGRAARNLNGRVILYADKMTPSMQQALNETNRRRIIQYDYNQEHNIIPVSVKKKVHGGIISTLKLEASPEDIESKTLNKTLGHARDHQLLEKKIAQLKKQMQMFSKQLRFEEAARLRNEIKELKELLDLV
ncbi:MAG: excinuclease ABC subunit UvrB [Oligoflexia bacterium]|nr:excinuclease ABC subunit UvrB [Oligoflexia bacterium]